MAEHGGPIEEGLNEVVDQCVVDRIMYVFVEMLD